MRGYGSKVDFVKYAQIKWNEEEEEEEEEIPQRKTERKRKEGERNTKTLLEN